VQISASIMRVERVATCVKLLGFIMCQLLSFQEFMHLQTSSVHEKVMLSLVILHRNSNCYISGSTLHWQH